MLSLASRCDYDYRKTCEGAGSVSRLDQVFLFELCSVSKPSPLPSPPPPFFTFLFAFFVCSLAGEVFLVDVTD